MEYMDNWEKIPSFQIKPQSAEDLEQHMQDVMVDMKDTWEAIDQAESDEDWDKMDALDDHLRTLQSTAGRIVLQTVTDYKFTMVIRR